MERADENIQDGSNHMQNLEVNGGDLGNKDIRGLTEMAMEGPVEAKRVAQVQQDDQGSAKTDAQRENELGVDQSGGKGPRNADGGLDQLMVKPGSDQEGLNTDQADVEEQKMQDQAKEVEDREDDMKDVSTEDAEESIEQGIDRSYGKELDGAPDEEVRKLVSDQVSKEERPELETDQANVQNTDMEEQLHNTEDISREAPTEPISKVKCNEKVGEQSVGVSIKKELEVKMCQAKAGGDEKMELENREELPRIDQPKTVQEAGDHNTKHVSQKEEAEPIDEKTDPENSNTKETAKEGNLLQKQQEEGQPIKTKEKPRQSSRKHGKGLKIPTQLKNLFMLQGKRSPRIPNSATMVHDDPPIYVFENFLKESEIQHLEQITTDENKTSFGKPSYTQDSNGNEVLSTHRTSTFTHLKKFGDTKVRNIERRAADIVGLPVENVEPLQIVRYKDGQYFGLHHDCGALTESGKVVGPARDEPVRLVTFFVYLNTVPPEGGGATVFPSLGGLKVQPKRGSAVLFCNVLENGDLDPRVIHEAAPTAKGVAKFGVNIWISSQSMLAYSLSNTGIVLKKQTTELSGAERGNGTKRRRSRGKPQKTATVDLTDNNDDEAPLKKKTTKPQQQPTDDKQQENAPVVVENLDDDDAVIAREPTLADLNFLFDEKHGYTVHHGTGLVEIFYTKPGVEVKSRKPVNGVHKQDYFNSNDELLEHVIKSPELLAALEASNPETSFIIPGRDIPKQNKRRKTR